MLNISLKLETSSSIFSGCKVFSLPTITDDRKRRVELGVKGNKDVVDSAFAYIKKMVSQLDCKWEELAPRL